MARRVVKFQCDLDLASDDCRQRIQCATGWSLPRLLEGALRSFEQGTIAKLTDAERDRYMRCELSRDELVAANERWMKARKKTPQRSHAVSPSVAP